MSAGQVTALATCLVAVATVVGVAIAVRGLRTWRVQLAASADFDLARRLLLEVYRLRDALEQVRHPMMLAREAAGADPDIPWEISAYERRWQAVLDVQAPLQVCIYECQILWGDQIEGLKRGLMKQVATLSVAVSAFARSKQDAGSEDLGEEHRKVLYWGMGEDTFGDDLRKTIASFEAYVRPHLPR